MVVETKTIDEGFVCEKKDMPYTLEVDMEVGQVPIIKKVMCFAVGGCEHITSGGCPEYETQEKHGYALPITMLEQLEEV